MLRGGPALVLAFLAAGCVFITGEDRRARIDQDGDGHSVLDDCDDRRAAVHPGAEEQCDGLDNDCDGTIDEDLFPDADGDGHGGPAEGPCQVDWQPVAGDCDDTDADVFPGQSERCNGRDDGCVAGWTPAHELGVVTWQGADGTVEDWTAAAKGTGDEPARLSPGPAGALHICRGTGAHRLRLVQGEAEDLEIVGHPIPLDGDTTDTDSWPVLNGLSATSPGPTVQLTGSTSTGMHRRVALQGLVITGGYTTATVPGGGLHLSRLSTATLSDLLVVGNQAVSGSSGGAGLYAGQILDLQLARVSLAQNSGVDGTLGGGALIENATTRMVDVDIEDNRAADGGGLAVHGSGSRLDLRDTRLVGNWGNRRGGGLFIGEGVNAFLVCVDIVDNRASEGAGAFAEGALSCFGGEDLLPSTWTDNTAEQAGAAAATAGSGAVSFAGCISENNTVVDTSTMPASVRNPELATYEVSTSIAPLAWSTTGPVWYCSWTTCHGDVEHRE